MTNKNKIVTFLSYFFYSFFSRFFPIIKYKQTFFYNIILIFFTLVSYAKANATTMLPTSVLESDEIVARSYALANNLNYTIYEEVPLSDFKSKGRSNLCTNLISAVSSMLGYAYEGAIKIITGAPATPQDNYISPRVKSRKLKNIPWLLKVGMVALVAMAKTPPQENNSYLAFPHIGFPGAYALTFSSSLDQEDDTNLAYAQILPDGETSLIDNEDEKRILGGTIDPKISSSSTNRLLAIPSISSRDASAEAVDIPAYLKPFNLFVDIYTTKSKELVKELQIAADAGNFWAQGYLGIIYALRSGYPTRDQMKANFYITRALDRIKAEAAKGHPYAMTIMGLYNSYLIEPSNYTEAVRYFQLAQEKDVLAVHNLAHMYKKGFGTEKDLKKAFELYLIAHQRGFLHANCELAYHYLFGIGTDKNEKMAIELLKAAALKFDVCSMHYLGTLYTGGHGVTKDINLGIKYLENAASQGSGRAKYDLGRLYFDGVEIAEDQEKALQWFRSAEEHEDPVIQYHIADLYEWVISPGNKKNKNIDSKLAAMEAVRLFRKLAHQGFPRAQYMLGVYYNHGVGVAINEFLAAKWFEKSAKQNYVLACSSLGSLYEMGRGVNRDEEEAFKYYTLAVNAGLVSAKYKLGYMFYFGLGVDQDKEKGMALYEASKEQVNPKLGYETLYWFKWLFGKNFRSLYY